MENNPVPTSLFMTITSVETIEAICHSSLVAREIIYMMTLRDKKTSHEKYDLLHHVANFLWSVTLREKGIAEIRLCCKYSAMLLSLAFQESYAFFNHLRLSLLRTPSLFPTDHLLTHMLSPLWSLVDLDSFNYTASCCHDTDGVH